MNPPQDWMRRAQQIFITLLKNLNRERGLSILIVSHDLQEMPRLTDTIYCLSHQKITRLDAKEMRTYV